MVIIKIIVMIGSKVFARLLRCHHSYGISHVELAIGRCLRYRLLPYGQCHISTLYVAAQGGGESGYTHPKHTPLIANLISDYVDGTQVEDDILQGVTHNSIDFWEGLET